MEKVTISRVGQEKEIQTKFGAKKKTGVQFKEYGEVWHDIWMGGLKEGQELEGTRESREYQGKTYWDFKLPKKEDIQNAQNAKLEHILTKVAHNTFLLEQILEAVKGKPKLIDPMDGRDLSGDSPF